MLASSIKINYYYYYYYKHIIMKVLPGDFEIMINVFNLSFYEPKRGIFFYIKGKQFKVD